ncbi:MAG TPA: hypothetical protein VM389_07920 [Phycisphaerae bacterium]|nr:hypothetical protein [Phycisphaerae bacterium]
MGLPGPVFYTAVQPAHYGGVPLATMVSPYTGAFAGTVTSNVYAGPPGILGFEYVFTNTSSIPGIPTVVRATIGSVTSPWLGFSIVDAGADASGSSTAGGGPITWTDGDPFSILRDPTSSGEGITFEWRVLSLGTVLRGPADVSSEIWVDVVASQFTVANVAILDSGSVASAKGYVPAIIPEPITLSAGIASLCMLGGYLRKRRQA